MADTEVGANPQANASMLDTGSTNGGKKYRVDPDALDSVYKDLSQLLDEAAGILEEIYKETITLPKTWQGDNSLNFMNDFLQRRTNVGKSGLRMSRFAQALKLAAASYHEMEEEINKLELNNEQ